MTTISPKSGPVELRAAQVAPYSRAEYGRRAPNKKPSLLLPPACLGPLGLSGSSMRLGSTHRARLDTCIL
jgi:hypothetical protein